MSDKGEGGRGHGQKSQKMGDIIYDGQTLPLVWFHDSHGSLSSKNLELQTLNWVEPNTIDNPFYLIIGLNCVISSLKSDWYDHYHIMWIWWCVIDMKIQTRFSWLQKFHHIWGKKDSEIFRIGTICSFVFTHLIFSIAKLVYKMIFLDQA